MTGSNRFVQKSFRLGLISRDFPPREIFPSANSAKPQPALFIRFVDERAAIEEKAIEQVEREGDLARRRFNSMDALKAAHELLKRKWPAVLSHRHDLCVEDERIALKILSRNLGDFRKALSDFRKAPAPDANHLSVSVDLNSCPVVLKLKRCFACVSLKDFIEVLGEFREHGEKRYEKLDIDSLKTFDTFRNGDRSDFREVGKKESRAAYEFQIGAGGVGDGLLNQAIVQADAQFVMEQAK